jgi:hypothetical protein
MDPFLFYHEYSSLEQKKNYCEIMKIIECCIENAIRRLLPLSAIFEKLLGSEPTFNGKALDLIEVYNMPLLLDIPIEKKQEVVPNINNISGGANDILQEPSNNILQVPSNNILQDPTNNILQVPFNNMMIGGNSFNNSVNENNINEKILNIINKNNVLSDSNDNNHFTIHNHSANDNNMQPNMMNNMQPNMMNNMQQKMQNKHHSDRNSSSTLKRIVHESIKQTQQTATKTNSDVKNKILKDLDSDTITYNPEENAENYQDIFSNSDMKHTVNTNEKNEKKSREKFFNNYLNI